MSGRRDYSRAYLHHLVRSQEALGAMLLTWNNLSYYQSLMADLRSAIGSGSLWNEAQRFRGLGRGDLPPL